MVDDDLVAAVGVAAVVHDWFVAAVEVVAEVVVVAECVCRSSPLAGSTRPAPPAPCPRWASSPCTTTHPPQQGIQREDRVSEVVCRKRVSV